MCTWTVKKKVEIIQNIKTTVWEHWDTKRYGDKNKCGTQRFKKKVPV